MSCFLGMWNMGWSGLGVTSTKLPGGDEMVKFLNTAAIKMKISMRAKDSPRQTRLPVGSIWLVYLVERLCRRVAFVMREAYVDLYIYIYIWHDIYLVITVRRNLDLGICLPVPTPKGRKPSLLVQNFPSSLSQRSGKNFSGWSQYLGSKWIDAAAELMIEPWEWDWHDRMQSRCWGNWFGNMWGGDVCIAMMREE